MGNVVELLDRPTYLYADVDRLIGVPSGTARRWINGYTRGGRIYEPILRVAAQQTDWVTWGEFVEARMLAQFRDDVPTARLRAAVERLRCLFGVSYPLAHLTPYLQADEELGELTIDSHGLDPDDEGILIVRTGQRILRSARDLMEHATLADDGNGERFAVELQPDPEFPGVKVNPGRAGGQPTFEGRRITVATIAGMVGSGEPAAELASTYGLSLAQVHAAVSYSSKYRLVS